MKLLDANPGRPRVTLQTAGSDRLRHSYAGGAAKTALMCQLLCSTLLAIAGVDKPWQESDWDGASGQSLPGASLLFGILGASYLALQSLRNDGSIGTIVTAAVLGFAFGSILGLPVSCMLR